MSHFIADGLLNIVNDKSGSVMKLELFEGVFTEEDMEELLWNRTIATILLCLAPWMISGTSIKQLED